MMALEAVRDIFMEEMTFIETVIFLYIVIPNLLETLMTRHFVQHNFCQSNMRHISRKSSLEDLGRMLLKKKEVSLQYFAVAVLVWFFAMVTQGQHWILNPLPHKGTPAICFKCRVSRRPWGNEEPKPDC